MIYLESIYDVIPRNKVAEALQLHKDIVFPLDKGYFDKAGAKFVGIWHTDVGRIGQIKVVTAWPDLATRAQVDKEFGAEPKNKDMLQEWFALTPTATRTLWFPASHSPLQ